MSAAKKGPLLFFTARRQRLVRLTQGSQIPRLSPFCFLFSLPSCFDGWLRFWTGQRGLAAALTVFLLYFSSSFRSKKLLTAIEG